MMIRVGRASMCISLLFFVISCAAAGSPNDANEFSKMTSEQRQSFILSQPVDRRVEVYIDMLRAIRPPDLSLESTLASSGKRIIPDLKEQLQRSESDVVKLHLIMVFYRMQRSETYSVASDSELMDFLETEASEIEGSEWREMALKEVAKIRDTDSRDAR